MNSWKLRNSWQMLDDMHKRKIDMSDEIFVINPGGYIGESTDCYPEKDSHTIYICEIEKMLLNS